MEAFRESRFVWFAMSSICFAMSLIRVRDFRFTMASSTCFRFFSILSPVPVSVVSAISRILCAVSSRFSLFRSPAFTFSSTFSTSSDMVRISFTTCSMALFVVAMLAASSSVVAELSPIPSISICDAWFILSVESFRVAVHSRKVETIFRKVSYRESNAVAI